MAVVRWDPALYCSKVLRPRRVIIFYCHSTWQPALVCIGSFSRGFRAILTNKRAGECLMYLVGKGKMRVYLVEKASVTYRSQYTQGLDV